MRVLEQTDELKMDMTEIMTLQRNLSSIERNLAAIQTELDALKEESVNIANTHSEEAVLIQQRTVRLRGVWEQLTEMLNERDAKRTEERYLDHFKAKLSKLESDITNEDAPSSLAEAEKFLSTHQQILKEIDNYTNCYSFMM